MPEIYTPLFNEDYKPFDMGVKLKELVGIDEGKNLTKLGSSPTQEMLIILLGEFWYENDLSNISLNKDGIITKNGKTMSVKWWKKGKRYYFGY